jgi:hypothetical protein
MQRLPATVPPFSDTTILRSPLVVGSGGFRLYASFPDPAPFSALLSEALSLYPTATSQENWDVDHEELRGGKPRRKLLSTGAGPVQDALYAQTSLHQWLSAECRLTIVPSGNRGSYSYYVRDGDFLDLHRDIETCDVTMITVLHDNSLPIDSAGALVIYPGHIGKPLSAVRERPHEGASVVKVAAGQTIIMFGGVVPHRVLPVAQGQVRIISVLCFQALTSG